MEGFISATAALWATTVVVACAAMGALWSYVRRARLLAAFPSPAAPSWLAGHLSIFLDSRAPLFMADFAERYGPIVRLRLFNQPLLLVTDPWEAAKVLRRGPGYLPKARPIYDALEVGIEPRTPSLLTANDGALWKAVRTAVAPAFSATSLRQVLPHLVDLTRTTAATIEAAGGRDVDVAGMAKRITSDVMGSLLFGEDLQGVAGKPSEYLECFNAVLEATHARLANPLRPIAALWSEQVRRECRVLSLHNRLMAEKLASIKAGPPPPPFTIIAHLLGVVDPNTGRGLTDVQLRAEMGTIFGAGFETTSHAITWTLAALAAHPQWQDAVVQELAAAGLAPTKAQPGPPRDFCWADVARLPVLTAAIKESLRLFSPASLGTTRMTDREVQIGGRAVPPGVMVMVSPFATSLQSRLFGPDAREFRPDRWLLEGAKPCAPPGLASSASLASASWDAADTAPQGDQYAAAAAAAGGAGAGEGAAAQPRVRTPDAITLAFSEGPRSCVGQSLALLELQVVVGTLVGRFQWGGDARSVADLHAKGAYHVTWGTHGGEMRLRATPREPVAVDA